MNVQANIKQEDGSYENIFFKNNENNVYDSEGKSIEGKYVKKTGDTMTGNLICPAVDTKNDATNRLGSLFATDYEDTLLNNYKDNNNITELILSPEYKPLTNSIIYRNLYNGNSQYFNVLHTGNVNSLIDFTTAGWELVYSGGSGAFTGTNPREQYTAPYSFTITNKSTYPSAFLFDIDYTVIIGSDRGNMNSSGLLDLKMGPIDLSYITGERMNGSITYGINYSNSVKVYFLVNPQITIRLNDAGELGNIQVYYMNIVNNDNDKMLTATIQNFVNPISSPLSLSGNYYCQVAGGSGYNGTVTYNNSSITAKIYALY